MGSDSVESIAELARYQEKETDNEIEFDIQKKNWPQLDLLALHGVAGELTRKIEPHTEADPVAILVQLLTMWGNAAGRNCYFQVERDKHYPNIFSVLVGETAKARKGTSKNIILHIMRKIDDVWEDNRVESGLSSGEGLIWSVRDPIKKKKDGREYVDDPGIDDKRLLVVESELASTLRVLNREGNTLSPKIRDAWDHPRGKLQTMTKNSAAVATGAHISIIGHITKNELTRYLTETEAGNGFGNRFLWVCVRRSKLLPEGGDLQKENLAPETRRLRSALEFAKQPRQVEFDDEARKMWWEVYGKLSTPPPGLMGAITARAEAQTLRLALLYALLDENAKINFDHLTAALALWRYCEESARYIFGDSLGDPVADKILEELKKKTDGLTSTEIYSDVFNHHKTSEEIKRALTELLNANLIQKKEEETGGRPKQKWSLKKE